jgi:hypothetical protein
VSAPARGAAALAAVLAFAGCSPHGKPIRNEAAGVRAAAAVAPAPVVQTPARIAPVRAPASLAAAPAQNAVRRCGWLVNPTPGNWWLYDREGEWILATQGSEPAAGMDALPDMSGAGWVETNGHYGYGCACATIASDPATRRVLSVANAAPKPLKQCRADKRLPRP